MTRRLFIPFLTFFTLYCHGQDFSDKLKKDTLDLKPIELTVKLADNLKKIKLPPSCGIFQPADMTFKFKVIKVLSGEYHSKTILINFRCPRELIEQKRLENGKLYNYKLRPNRTQINVDKNTKPTELEYEVIE